jgi:probable HAF family extracellular repeat protein
MVMKTQLSRALSLLAAVSLLWATPASAALYTPTDLSTPAGYTSGAYAVNGAGVVVGEIKTPDAATGQQHATVWFEGRVTDLGMLVGGRWSIAYGVSNNGLIVGVSETTGRTFWDRHAVLWDHGVMIDLGTLSGQRHSAAYAVNNARQVVGDSGSGTPVHHAFLWQNGAMIDLAPQSAVSSARDINGSGQIVGNSSQPENPDLDHATLWQDGQTIDLGASYAGLSYARAINDLGQVVGYVDNGITQRAVTWINGQMTVLPTWAGGGATVANDVNNKGEIVGTAQTANGSMRAVLWKSGRIIDLGTLGGRPFAAQAINGVGVIVGWSGYRVGDAGPAQATLWTK